MKKQELYTKDKISYIIDLEKIVTKSVISKNKSFFEECWQWQVPPERAVRLLTK